MSVMEVDVLDWGWTLCLPIDLRSQTSKFLESSQLGGYKNEKSVTDVRPSLDGTLTGKTRNGIKDGR